MQINCVHEGKDYEYKVSFSKEQKEKLAASLKTQISKNNLYVKGKYIAMEKDIKDTSYISCIENFDYQALKDGQRSKSLYKYNGEIIKALLSWDANVEMAAVPIVGEGNIYKGLGVPILTPTRTLPSGGFLYMNPLVFLKDIASGLIGLLGKQLQIIWMLAAMLT
jgi:hypothetical protein